MTEPLVDMRWMRLLDGSITLQYRVRTIVSGFKLTEWSDWSDVLCSDGKSAMVLNIPRGA